MVGDRLDQSGRLIRKEIKDDVHLVGDEIRQRKLPAHPVLDEPFQQLAVADKQTAVCLRFADDAEYVATNLGEHGNIICRLLASYCSSMSFTWPTVTPRKVIAEPACSPFTDPVKYMTTVSVGRKK